MKVKILFILIILASVSYAQTNNEVNMYYDIVKSELLQFPHSLDGDYFYNTDKTYSFGLNYIRTLKNNLGINIGINYLQTDIIYVLINKGKEVYYSPEHLKLMTIPIIINYTIKQYFFINGGISADLQTNSQSFDNQSGIGGFLGLGCKYAFNNIAIFINPHLKMHSLLTFDKYDKYHYKLKELGIRIGVGYKF